MPKTGMTLRARQVKAQLKSLADVPSSAGAQALMLSLAEITASQIRQAAADHRDTGDLDRAIQAAAFPAKNGLPAASFVEIDSSAWYWFFIEFGTIHIPADPFIARGAQQAGPRVAAGMQAGYEKLIRGVV